MPGIPESYYNPKQKEQTPGFQGKTEMFDCPEVAAEHKERSSMGRNPLGCSMARYYNPAVGRFISEDPLGFRSSKNLYPYVLNSPIETIDPLGLIATTMGCCKDKTKQIEDAAEKACKDSKNGKCRQVLNKYNLSKCIDEKCKKPIPFRCWGTDPQHPNRCAEVETNEGGGTAGVIRIYPGGLSQYPTTTGCGNLSGTIVHELAHLCDLGPDFPPANYPENYYKAKNIQAACDDDPSTLGN